jgi:hypothetical protein
VNVHLCTCTRDDRDSPHPSKREFERGAPGAVFPEGNTPAGAQLFLSIFCISFLDSHSLCKQRNKGGGKWRVRIEEKGKKKETFSTIANHLFALARAATKRENVHSILLLGARIEDFPFLSDSNHPQ